MTDGDAPDGSAALDGPNAPPERTGPEAPDEATGGAVFWVGLVVGGAVMAYAVWGMVDQYDAANPPALARWLIGGALLHDLLLAPIVTVVGLVLARLLPRRARGTVLAATALSVLVIVFSIPMVRGFGARPGNPSALPLDYGRNVALVVGAVWVVAAVVVALRWRREPA